MVFASVAMPELPVLSLFFAVLLVIALFVLSLAGREISWIWSLLVLVAFIGLGVVPVALKMKDFEAKFKTVSKDLESKEKDVNDLNSVKESKEREVDKLQAENDALKQRDALRSALQQIVADRRNDWGGTFEREYSTQTVFFANHAGTKAPPLKVYDMILQWRGRLSGGRAPLFGILTDALWGSESMAASEVSANLERFVQGVGREVHLLDFPECNRLLILGEPASGKTTLLRYDELVAARRSLSTQSPNTIPIFINLAQTSIARPEDLETEIKHSLEKRGVNPETLRSGQLKATLLLDALDEAADMKQASRAIAYVSSQSWVDRILVTCRIDNYADKLHPTDLNLEKSGFLTAFLYGTGLDAIERRIFLSERMDSVKKSKLLAALADPSTRAEWLQFLRLPSNFNLVVDVFLEQKGSIPPRPWALFDAFFQSRLDAKINDAATESAIYGVLEAEAKQLSEDGMSNRDRIFTAAEARVAISHSSSDFANIGIQDVESYLDGAVKAAILTGGEGSYRFTHLQYLDFCVARGLEDVNSIPIEDVHWRQIILFRIGRDDALSHQLLARVVAKAKASQVESFVRFAIGCIDNVSATPEETDAKKQLQGYIAPLSQG